MPSAMADISSRLKLKFAIAILKAPPSGPTSAPAGACTSSSVIWQSSNPCMPSRSSGLPRCKPGDAPSRRKQLIALCPPSAPVRANTVSRSITPPQRHPGLGPAQHPAAAVTPGRGAHARHVGAVVRLADGGGGDGVAGHDRRDQAALRRVAVLVEEQSGLDRYGEGVGDRAGATRQLLHRDASARGRPARRRPRPRAAPRRTGPARPFGGRGHGRTDPRGRWRRRGAGSRSRRSGGSPRAGRSARGQESGAWFSPMPRPRTGCRHATPRRVRGRRSRR